MKDMMRCGLWMLGILLPALAGPSLAEQMYRWVDAQGLVHLSDQAPADSVQTQVLSTPSYAAPRVPPGEDPYSILNQARRLEQQREQIVRERQKAEQARREHELEKRRLEAARNSVPPERDMAPRIIVPRPYVVAPRARMPYQYPQPRGLWKDEHPAYSPSAGRHYPGARPRVSR